MEGWRNLGRDEEMKGEEMGEAGGGNGVGRNEKIEGGEERTE